MKPLRRDTLPFRPRARILVLLGEQLMREPGIAVFELVKNAHDADASHVTVTMENIDNPKKGRIIVEDNGAGMDWETLTGVWLEPGTDFRAAQKERGKRTPHFHRVPMGEKGIGRFAAHKLGTHIELVSRMKGQPEVHVEIDWTSYDKGHYLDEIKNAAHERTPQTFPGNKIGTKIIITGLRQPWTRRMLRDLSRSITSICSPFKGPREFQPRLAANGYSKWLDGLMTVEKVKDHALYEAQCRISGGELTYSYQFKPWKILDRVKARERKVGKTEAIKLARLDSRDKRPLNLNDHAIGPVVLDLLIFDLDHRLLALGVSDKRGLKDYLDENGGIRVYRDGIRVYDYGEPGNDWLDLEGRRVNLPSGRLGNNLVIGAVALDGQASMDLIEKTNREGFVIEDAFSDLVEALRFAIVQIEAERRRDKESLRLAYNAPQPHEPVLQDLAEIGEVARKKGIENELKPYLRRIEKDFIDIRDRFLTSASAGLSLTIVIHEVEKGLTELGKAVQSEPVSPRVKKLAEHLANLVEGLGAIARQSGTTKERISALIRQAVFNTELRAKYHKTKVKVDISDGDFEAKCSRRLIIATLMNLIDNSLWWLRHQTPAAKEIRIFTTNDLKGGRAVVVADNNTQGFIDPPEIVVRPFFSRKPDGMGLGLHLADQVMRVQGGSLQFPDPGDVGLSKEFRAIVALVFGGTE